MEWNFLLMVCEASWMLDYFSLLGKSYLLKGQEDLFMLLGFGDYLLIPFTVGSLSL
jgi:hypothetical protein